MRCAWGRAGKVSWEAVSFSSGTVKAKVSKQSWETREAEATLLRAVPYGWVDEVNSGRAAD